MNREIKFRAWGPSKESYFDDTPANVMTYDVQDQYDYDPLTAASFGDILINDKWVVMQFTGLKDKNGKEIYEGDIVRLDSWSPSDYEVRFIDGAFCLWKNGIPYAHDIHYVHHAGNNQATIIGNIYENPELLEGGSE